MAGWNLRRVSPFRSLPRRTQFVQDAQQADAFRPQFGMFEKPAAHLDRKRIGNPARGGIGHFGLQRILAPPALGGHLLGGICRHAGGAQPFQFGHDFGQREFRSDSLAIRAQHHRIGPADAIGGGLQTAQENVARPEPEKGMIEALELLVRGQIFPRARIDLSADAG